MPAPEQPVLSPEDKADQAVEGRLLEVGQRFEKVLRERVVRILLSRPTRSRAATHWLCGKSWRR
jgi:hypothetical protein